MARMVNCPNSVLENLCHDNGWYEIIKQCNNVRVPDKNPIDLANYVKDEPQTEWEILDRDGVRIYDNQPFVAEAINAPSKMLNCPKDIYVYPADTRRDIADKNEYGVLLSTPMPVETKNLKRHWNLLLDVGKESSWFSFLKKDPSKMLPSNALIIVDRYLFSDFQLGIDNLFCILEELLPMRFDGQYHILLIFDDQTIKKGFNAYDVAKRIQKQKKKIRPYFLNIELLSVNKQTSIYPKTHDRKILSNYFVVTATHGFAAFREGKAVYEQRLEYDAIYWDIDNDDQGKSSLPVYMVDDFTDSLRKFLNDTEKCDHGIAFFVNGQEKENLSELCNRLVRD